MLEGQKRDTIVFASETSAFDLIGATYEREVKPGELVVVGPEGISSRFFASLHSPWFFIAAAMPGFRSSKGECWRKEFRARVLSDSKATIT